MSVTINESAIHSRGASNPTHSAPRGVLYLNTATRAVFVQNEGPEGTDWVPVRQSGGMIVFGEIEELFVLDYPVIVFAEV